MGIYIFLLVYAVLVLTTIFLQERPNLSQKKNIYEGPGFSIQHTSVVLHPKLQITIP